MNSQSPHQSALRKGRRDIPNQCYFITTAVAERQPILGDGRAAGIVVDTLAWLQDHGAIRLMGFVVMPDHLHAAFVLEPLESRAGARSYEHNQAQADTVGAASRPRPGLAAVMRRFKSYTARKINDLLGRKRPLWQSGYRDHLIRDRKDFETRLSYMHGNPLRKELAQFEHEYEFSTANPKYSRLIDWAWLDGVEDGRGRAAAPTERRALSPVDARASFSPK
jgi:REP element-mobilizing transposase RayT